MEDHGPSRHRALRILAGIHTSGETAAVAALHLRPCFRWKTRVLTVKEVCRRASRCYMGTFVTKTQSRIAVRPSVTPTVIRACFPIGHE